METVKRNHNTGPEATKFTNAEKGVFAFAATIFGAGALFALMHVKPVRALFKITYAQMRGPNAP